MGVPEETLKARKLFSKRLTMLLEKRKMNQNELARLLEVSESAVGKWTLGKSMPRTMGIIQKISDIFNVPKTFLLEESLKTNANLEIPNIPGIIPIEEHKIPIIGSIAAGKPILAEENAEGYATSPVKVQADFALKVKGDSMEGVPILDGDIVFIRSQPEVENGEIAAVLIDNEATLKRFYNRGNSVMLVSENPKYAPFIYTAENCDEFRILGKAVAYQHYFEGEN